MKQTNEPANSGKGNGKGNGLGDGKDQTDHALGAGAEEKGFAMTAAKIVGWGAVLIGIYLVLSNFPIFSSGVIDPKAGLAIVFVTGLLTSLHCIGMCSGFVISYASNSGSKGVTPHLCYNGSRMFSYVALGALVGLIGSVFSFNDQIRSYLSIFAGVFMVAYGLSMFLPQLRRFVTLPGFDVQKYSKGNPIMFGLLNGLMPCGPLQAMLIYAAGTGSAIEGGLTMLAFGLGTVPLMFIMGTAVSMASMKWTHKIIKFSGALVLVLGIIMLNRGFALSGITIPITLAPIGTSGNTGNTISNSLSPNTVSFQEINMTITRNGWEPDSFVVQKGIPVRWNIYAKELTYCNKGIKAPSLGITYTFQEGERKTFEFTPTQTGTIPFTCWMGMIPGQIVVKERTLN
jgi:sulfite exporter TauE/SafE/plastocyanin